MHYQRLTANLTACLLAVGYSTAACLAAPGQPGRASFPLPASIEPIRGTVVRTVPGAYVVNPITMMPGSTPATPFRIHVTGRSRFYLLVPASLSSARPGWMVHAIGDRTGHAVRANMVVLFPPASAAGVPPGGVGMTNVGRLASTHPLRLRLMSGEVVDVDTGPKTRVYIAEQRTVHVLRPGDFTMTFGISSPRGLYAAIVHILHTSGM